MKKPTYRTAVSRIKTSEDFKERTLERLRQEAQHIEQSHLNRGGLKMTNQTQRTPKATRKAAAWTVGLAACAVLAFGIYMGLPNNGTAGDEGPPVTSAPPHSAKQQVNIDGVIEEVSEDGKSFRIGSLWVTVTDETVYGITGPNAPDPSEQLVSKEFKVGNTVSGFTSEDVTSGKVTADAIYNNF